jgi:transposase
LFLFLEDATNPTTNNSSEQTFRMSKVFMKVTNCFPLCAKELFAGVRSVINTGKRQGLNAYQATKRALSPFGSFFGSQHAQE